MSDPGPPQRDRHWPRDAPVRWGAFAGGLAFHLVALVSVAAHLVVGGLSIVAILGPAVDGVGEWLLAIAWGALALLQFRAWWFRPSWPIVAAAPLIAGVLLAVLTGER